MRYFATNLAVARYSRVLRLLFLQTSSAASPLTAVRLAVELPESRRVDCVSNGPKSGGACRKLWRRAWTVREQNWLLGVCFGLQAVNKT